MQAAYREITPGFYPKVRIIGNHLITKIDHSKRSAAKYRKVGKATKEALLEKVSAGCSIVMAAQLFKINYSTAKSIVQNYKSKNDSKVFIKEEDSDLPPSRDEKMLSESREGSVQLKAV